MPMLIFLAAAGVLAYIMQFTRAGFSIHMIGSNLKATEYSAIPSARLSAMRAFLPSA